MERSNRVSQCVLSTAIIENRTAWAQFFFADHCSAFVHYVMRQAVRHIENIAVLTNILQFHTNHNFIDLRQNKKGFLQHVTRCVHTGPGRHTNQTDVRQYGDTDNYIAQKWSSGEIGWPHFFGRNRVKHTKCILNNSQLAGVMDGTAARQRMRNISGNRCWASWRLVHGRRPIEQRILRRWSAIGRYL